MRINAISRNLARPVSFNGMFRQVREDVYTDVEQRYEVQTIHSIYYPNKDESEEDIKKAMDAYRENGRTYGGGMAPDGGRNPDGSPTLSQRWEFTTQYTCERGDRLPF